MQVVRLLRLMRLIKLFRMVRASSAIKHLENHLSVNSAIISLVKYFVLVVVCAHWLACCWAFVGGSESESQTTWVDEAANNPKSPGEIYAVALYFSIMTITTVGA